MTPASSSVPIAVKSKAVVELQAKDHRSHCAAALGRKQRSVGFRRMARRKADNGRPTQDGRSGSQDAGGWLWDAACQIRGPLDAPKFKDYILPLIFLKRLSDVFEDEVQRVADEVGDAEIAQTIIDQDHASSGSTSRPRAAGRSSHPRRPG